MVPGLQCKKYQQTVSKQQQQQQGGRVAAFKGMGV